MVVPPPFGWFFQVSDALFELRANLPTWLVTKTKRRWSLAALWSPVITVIPAICVIRTNMLLSLTFEEVNKRELDSSAAKRTEITEITGITRTHCSIFLAKWANWCGAWKGARKLRNLSIILFHAWKKDKCLTTPTEKNTGVIPRQYDRPWRKSTGARICPPLPQKEPQGSQGSHYFFFRRKGQVGNLVWRTKRHTKQICPLGLKRSHRTEIHTRNCWQKLENIRYLCLCCPNGSSEAFPLKLRSLLVFGAESAIRPDSLQRAGALGLLHQLLVRFGNDVGTLDDEALRDECSDEKGTNGMLSNDMKDKMSAGWNDWRGLFKPDNLILSQGVRWCAQEKVCCARSKKSILCTLPVACSELRLTGRENAHLKKKNNLDGGKICGTCRE